MLDAREMKEERLARGLAEEQMQDARKKDCRDG
jgi:hypothetical protein